VSHDRSTLWIALADLLFAVLAVVIVQVSESKAKIDGLQMHDLIEITIEWSIDPLDIDADVDLHVMPPDGKPIFYGSRQRGCVALNTDNKGFQDSHKTRADGSTIRMHSDVEVTTIRCPDAGPFVAAVNLFAYRANGLSSQGERHDLGIKVHCKIEAKEPTVHTITESDVTLDRVGQTINFHRSISTARAC
jgi:hypothetical protein